MSVSRMDWGGGAVVDDGAFVQDVGAVDDVQDAFDVVFYDHNGGVEALADFGHFLEDFGDDDGGEAQSGFVQQQQFRGCHQAAAQGEHLLLAAGHLAGQIPALLVEDGEEFHYGIQAAGFFGAVVEVEAAHGQVFGDGEVGEDAAALCFARNCRSGCTSCFGGLPSPRQLTHPSEEIR